MGGCGTADPNKTEETLAFLDSCPVPSSSTSWWEDTWNNIKSFWTSAYGWGESEIKQAIDDFWAWF